MLVEGGESEDGERRENRIGSASKVIIAVAVVASIAVTKLHVALILLLVDPFEDVLMAIMRRGISAIASAPRARRVLRTGPLQNFKVPSSRRLSTSILIPRARRIL